MNKSPNGTSSSCTGQNLIKTEKSEPTKKKPLKSVGDGSLGLGEVGILEIIFYKKHNHEIVGLAK